jgi:hypothetical protein
MSPREEFSAWDFGERDVFYTNFGFCFWEGSFFLIYGVVEKFARSFVFSSSIFFRTFFFEPILLDVFLTTFFLIFVLIYSIISYSLSYSFN